jgi:uncharacterized protein (TIGR02996 family)
VDEEGLLLAIRQEPGNDAPRLIYADFLKDHGRADRALFIRTQLTLVAMAENDSRRRALERQVRRLLRANARAWYGNRPGRAVSVESDGVTVRLDNPDARLTFRRGFIAGAAIGLAPLPEEIAWLFQFAPIEEVSLLGRDPIVHGSHFWGRSPGDDPELAPEVYPFILPANLFDELTQGEYFAGVRQCRRYDNRQAALDDLSAVCVRLGRQGAGLSSFERTRDAVGESVAQGGRGEAEEGQAEG